MRYASLAFDSGWICLEDNLTILVNNKLPDTKDYDFIRTYAGKKVAKPIRDELVPDPTLS